MAQRILILYATTDGQTGKIARAIGRTLHDVGVQALVVNAADAQGARPEDFDAVIVAASVHAGGYQRSVVRWVRAHLVGLNGRPTAFVSVCLGVLQHDPVVDREIAAIAERFFGKTLWRPHEVKVVAGALMYTKYWWWKRLAMRRIVAKAHGDIDTSRDFEYTDWEDVALFAKRFALKIQNLAPVRLAV